MSDAAFSVLTVVYTVGGLLGSLFASRVMDRWGRRDTLRVSAAFFAAGAGIMAVCWSMEGLVLGR